MDLDMDFSDISDDKVQNFLTAKLEAIRLENEALETVLNERQQVLQQTLPNIPVGLHIENVWKKIFNQKYTIGFELLGPSAFENIKVVLTSDFEEYISYKVRTFALSPLECPCTAGKKCQYIICGFIKRSDSFKNRAYVTLSFNVPHFLHKLKFDLTGYVMCTLNGQDVDVPLPNLELTANDSACQSNWLTEKNSLPSLFTIISCTNMIDLVICLPEEWRTPLVSTFEIHCSLTYVSVSDKAYFVANKISDLFDNTLVIIHPHEFQEGAENDVFLKVYTSSDQQLFAFLHHLLSCIPNSLVFPSMFYKSLLLCRKASYKEDRKKKLLEEFEIGMRADIDLSYYYTKMSCWKTYLAEQKTYQFSQHRRSLSEQENATDLQYLEIIKM